VFALVACLLPLSSSARADSGAVTWSVDHYSNVITVTANLTFIGKEALTPNEAGAAFADRVEAIKAEILRVWEGRPYKCFTLHVVIISHVASSESDTDGKSIPIRLLYTRTPTVHVKYLSRRGFVPNAAVNPLSDDPADAFPPATGGLDGASTWPLVANEGTYAQLFGIVMGLDLTFGRRTGLPIEGAPTDLMSGRNFTISPETMTRLIRRSGLDEKELKCPLTADLPRSRVVFPLVASLHLTAHLYTCDFDPPSSDPRRNPVATFKGTMKFDGELGAIPTLVGKQASGNGEFNATAVWKYVEPFMVVTSSTLRSRQGLTWTDGNGPPVALGVLNLAPPGVLYPVEGHFEFKLGAKECR
jgi:hypothetical protein